MEEKLIKILKKHMEDYKTFFQNNIEDEEDVGNTACFITEMVASGTCMLANEKHAAMGSDRPEILPPMVFAAINERMMANIKDEISEQ